MPCLLEISGSGGEDFLIFSIEIYYFAIISFGEGHGPKNSFEQTWISSTQAWFVPSLVEIGPVVQEKKILNIFNIILHFRYYLPLEKGAALHLNKFESPLPKDALCQVWFKFAKQFWRRFLNIFNTNLLFHYNLQMGMGWALH